MEITNINKVKNKLTGFFKQHEEILFSYLFGSRATGRAHKLSDIDIAIYIDQSLIDEKGYRYGYQAETLSDIMGLLGTSKVDLVILNHAKPLLRHRIIYYGKLIYSTDERKRIDFQVDTIHRYMDYKMLQKKIS
ncbi:MAG: type VII toxin-antitoxin system MntA family adenylyltransferase antitoxin [Actinomycetota bacterium]